MGRQNSQEAVRDVDFEAISCSCQRKLFKRPTQHSTLTPGSVTDAWTKDEMHMKKRYAKKNGTAGETCCERYGPLSHRQWNSRKSRA